MPLFKKQISKAADQELVDAMLKFVGAFKIVFRHDLSYTWVMTGDEEKDQTFIEPGLKVETADWGARGTLSEPYRYFVRVMDERGLKPEFSFPITVFLDLKKYSNTTRIMNLNSRLNIRPR